jgi:hypothetical protein
MVWWAHQRRIHGASRMEWGGGGQRAMIAMRRGADLEHDLDGGGVVESEEIAVEAITAGRLQLLHDSLVKRILREARKTPSARCICARLTHSLACAVLACHEDARTPIRLRKRVDLGVLSLSCAARAYALAHRKGSGDAARERGAWASGRIRTG